MILTGPSPFRDGPCQQTPQTSLPSSRHPVRELDSSPLRGGDADRVAVVGAGRLGTALTAALRAAGVLVEGPLGRGADGNGAVAVLLCVPDAQIAVAAAA